MNRVFLLLTIPLLASILSCGNKLSSKTESLVKELNKYEVMETDSVNMGIPSNAYNIFQQLEETASNSELVKLLDHKNPIVQGYSIWALVDRKYSDLASTFSELLVSKDTVVTSTADMVSHDPLASILYHRVNNKPQQIDISETERKFYQNLNDKLDSLIIYSDYLAEQNDFYSSYLIYRALLNQDERESNYNRVRKLALKYKNKHALVELAKYQNPEDIDEIKTFGSASFEAISYFPNHRFWEFLRSYQDSINTFSYFKAVSAYQNKAAFNQLTETFRKHSLKNDVEVIKDLDRALIVHYVPLYQDLILSIWKDHKIINFSMTKQLTEGDSQKSAKAFAEGLMKAKPFNYITLETFMNSKADSTLTLMLKNIREYYPELMPKVFQGSIMTADFLDQWPLIEEIRERKPDYAKPILLKRLDQKNYPFDAFHVSKTLLMFNDPKVKEKVTKILRDRKSEWDTGNWSDHFRELFDEYDINIK